MIEAPHYAASGAKHKGGFALPKALFDGTVNEPVLHEAVTAFLANQRQGTHATKTRAMVTGGGSKPWKQKGTGRARQGTIRAPHWPGGGVVFGPHPRDYRRDLPKKVKQLARRSALNARAREGSLLVIDGVDLEAPKTATIAALLESLGLAGQKVLVLTHGIKRNVYLSCRNLPGVDVLPFPEASAYHVLWADALVVEGAAIGADGASDVSDAAPAAPKKGRKKAAPRAKAAPKAKATAKAKAAPKAKAAAKAKPAATAKAPAKKKKKESE